MKLQLLGEFVLFSWGWDCRRSRSVNRGIYSLITARMADFSFRVKNCVLIYRLLTFILLLFLWVYLMSFWSSRGRQHCVVVNVFISYASDPSLISDQILRRPSMLGKDGLYSRLLSSIKSYAIFLQIYVIMPSLNPLSFPQLVTSTVTMSCATEMEWNKTCRFWNVKA